MHRPGYDFEYRRHPALYIPRSGGPVCVAWYRPDPDRVSLTGGLIDTLLDGSGQGNHLTQVGAARFAYTSAHASYNGRPVMTGVGAQYMQRGLWTGGAVAQPWTMLMICDAAGATQVVCDNGTGGGTDTALYFSSGQWRAASPANIPSGVAVVGGVRAHLFTANNPLSPYYIDNFTVPKITGASGANSLIDVTLGANNAGAGGIVGNIAEWLAFAGALTQAQMDYCRDYYNPYYNLAVV